MKTVGITLALVFGLSGLAHADLGNRETAVSEGRNTAYNAGTGALACGVTNLAANWLGLENKWATLGTMLVGNAAMIALRQPNKERGNVDAMSSVVGCSAGTLAAGAGVEIYSKRKGTGAKEAQQALLKDTKEAKLQEVAFRETVNKRFSDIDSKLTKFERPVDIKKVQSALGVTPATGFYGKKTRQAVTEFQKMKGLPVTGSLDRTTVKALGLDG